MPGGKRRALKKLLKQQQVADLPPPPAGAADEFITFSDDDEPTAPAVPQSSVAAVASASMASMASMASANSAASAASAASANTTTASASAASASAASADDSTPGTPGSGRGFFNGRGKKSSKQRFAERAARKQQALIDAAPISDPAWNAALEAERQDEIRVIDDACTVLGMELFEIQPDGHCMYSAVADQLGLLGILAPAQANNPYHTRRVTAQFMREHQDDFLPFLPSVDGEDMPGATDDGLMTPAQFQEYCHRVEKTAEWGGEPEIQALCRAFNVPIHVIQRGPPTVVSHGGAQDAFGGAMTPKDSLAAGPRVVRIAYHRRMYGLGEHYNSLRPAAA